MRVKGFYGDSFIVNGLGDVSFFDDSGATKFFWDASAERLGIGESNPATDLHITNSGATQLLLESGNTSQGILLFGDADDLNVGSLTYDHSDNSMRFETSDAERMRIDSSGNLLVGTTAVPTDDNTALGFGVTSSGEVRASVNGANAAMFKRATSDGDIVEFRKDNTTVGSIGAFNGDLSIGTGDTALRFHDGGNRIEPFNVSTNANTDGAVDLGVLGARFKDLYLSGGVYLGGTGSANKLDDYEEGTWTPTVTGTTSGSVAVTVYEATYTKIGDTVRLSCYLNGIDMTTSTVVGQYRISSLPFTGDPYSDVASVTFCNIFSFDESDISISGYCNGGHIMLFKGSSVTSITDSDTGTSTSGQIMLSITYKV